MSLAALPALAAPVRLPPRDECARDPSFAAFRTGLRRAVARRDAAALLARTDDRIKFSFGDEDGKAAFIRAWKLDRPAPSAIWPQLAEILRLGCAWENGRAVVPWLFARFPERLDVFSHMVVVRPTIARAAPNARSRVVTRLNSEILPATGDHGRPWLQVRLPDSRRAYVRSRDVRSPVDYRATFEKQGGRWRMTLFIAGD